MLTCVYVYCLCVPVCVRVTLCVCVRACVRVTLCVCIHVHFQVWFRQCRSVRVDVNYDSDDHLLLDPVHDCLTAEGLYQELLPRTLRPPVLQQGRQGEVRHRP